MKHILLLSLFFLLPFLGCNNETPTSPQETTVEKTEQSVRAENFLPQQQPIQAETQDSYLRTAQLFPRRERLDWANGGGRNLTKRESQEKTSYYTQNVRGVTNTYVPRALWAKIFFSKEVRGVAMCLAINNVGRFTTVLYPLNMYGEIIKSTVVNEGQEISYSAGLQLTQNGSINVNGVSQKWYSRECIERMLANQNVMGIRLFCGTSRNEFTFVLVSQTNKTSRSTETNYTETDDTFLPPPKNDQK